MKSLLLAGAMIVATGSVSFADGLYYWVVGNRATSKCDIVTRNPTIFPYGGGDFWFGDGPYTSVSDAKLARSNIRACPKDDPAADKDRAS
jgi:hypothetical protein